MKGSVKLPVFIDDARKYVNTTQLRAKYLGASYEAEYCQWQTLHGLGSLMETASLIITPNAYLEGKLIASYPPDPIGDFDVVRATTATRVNSAGLVELVPYNLLRVSNDFTSSGWGTTGTITPNATTAPDGTMTATRVQFASGGSYYLYQGPSFISGEKTISCYIKGATAQTIGFNDGNSVPNSINITTEWQRYTFTFNTNSGGMGIQFDNYYGVSPTNQAKDFYVWGAQLVEGSTAKDYQKTETRLNIPRLDYSNGSCPSILVEPQRTNLLKYSQDLTNIAWTAIGLITRTANYGVAPDGTTTSTRIQWNGLANYELFQYSEVSSPVFGTVYVKGVAGQTINFNGSIKTFNGNWQRIDNLLIVDGSNTYMSFRGIVGSITALDFEVWGAQGEAGSYATSYIPTTSASVTRNADVISKTGISSLIGQTEGTAFIDLQVDSSFAQANMRFLDISNNTYDNWYFLGLANTNELVLYFRSSATTYVSVIVPFTFGHNKIAFAYANNDYVAYVNGSQVYGTSSLAVGSTSKITLGNEFDFSSTSKQFINAAALWKERKDNATLAQLTTI
jgi:hypothetical protein